MSSSILIVFSLFILILINAEDMAQRSRQIKKKKKKNTTPIDFKLTHGPLTDYEVTDDPYWMKHKRKYKQFTRVKSTIQRSSQYSVLCIAPECPTQEKNTWENRLLYAQWNTTHH
eukprot:49094_1